jgi:uncharacterized protein (TIGR02300 family)
VAKPEWGVKRVCQSCGARFYDLMRQPIVCPACGAVFDLDAAARPRRSRPIAGKVAVVAQPELVKARKVAVVDDDAPFEEEEEAAPEDEDEDEESASPIEDASELGEDDDMNDVIEGGVDEEDDQR